MKQFNSKILLFGEYAVLNGASSLAIPFDNFFGSLEFPEKEVKSMNNIESNRKLTKLTENIKNKNFHANIRIQKLNEDITKGLFFNSNIPEGYGLGSSGALVAALYYEYFDWVTLSQNHIREDLAEIESFFHGSSSGIDPLVSFYNQPVYNQVVIDENLFFPSNLCVFLFDTGFPRETKKLVQLYRENCEKDPIRADFLVQKNDEALMSFFTKSENAYEKIKSLGQFQDFFLPKMMVKNNAVKMLEKQHSDKITFKLCGAGGGGYLLGFCHPEYSEIIIDYAKNNNLNIIKVCNSSPE